MAVGGSCREQRHRSGTVRIDSQQRGNIEAAFCYRVFDCGCGRDDRLGISLRLAHRPSSKVAVGLDQILGYSAANHDPEGKIHF